MAEQGVDEQSLPAVLLGSSGISVFGWSIGARSRQRCHHIGVLGKVFLAHFHSRETALSGELRRFPVTAAGGVSEAHRPVVHVAAKVLIRDRQSVGQLGIWQIRDAAFVGTFIALP